MDWQIQRPSRQCAVTGRNLAEGELYYAVLKTDAGTWQRFDYGAESWQGPPEGTIAWWRSRVPTRDGARTRLAPTEALVQMFEELVESRARPDLLYVVSLLLMRRRVLTLEDTETTPAGEEQVLRSSRNDETYRVAVVPLSAAQAAAIQAELDGLLAAGQ